MISGNDFRNRRGKWALFDGNGEIINYYRNASEAQAAWVGRPASESGTLVHLPTAVYTVTNTSSPTTVLKEL